MSLHGFSVGLDEDRFRGAAAEGFDADGSSAGENVDKERIRDRGAENVEKRFTQAVAGGAEFQQARAFQYAAPIFASDNTHRLILPRPDDTACATPGLAIPAWR